MLLKKRTRARSFQKPSFYGRLNCFSYFPSIRQHLGFAWEAFGSHSHGGHFNRCILVSALSRHQRTVYWAVVKVKTIPVFILCSLRSCMMKTWGFNTGHSYFRISAQSPWCTFTNLESIKCFEISFNIDYLEALCLSKEKKFKKILFFLASII